MKNIILASASPRRKELLRQLGLDFEIRPSEGEEIITKTKPEDIVKELAFQKATEISKQIQAEYRAGKEEYTGEPVKVIGADTIVVCDDQIFGKPVDEEDAKRMLTRLQGNTHQVYTGVCVITLFENNVDDVEARTAELLEKTEISDIRDTGFLEKTEIIDVQDTGFLEKTEIADVQSTGFVKKTEAADVQVAEFVEKTDVTMYPVSEQEILDYIVTKECMDKAGAYAIQGISARFIKEIYGDYNNVVGLPVARLWQECFKNRDY